MTPESISFTDLMASSVHDMKNSVNVQVHALEKIAAGARDRGDLEAFHDLILVIAQANRMNANLIQLLSLYKLGKSTYPLDIAEQSLAEVVDEAVLQLRSVLDFKSVQVEQDIAPEARDWYFDRDLITGVLLNALNNAIQYTRDRILILARVEAGQLVLRIEDNGTGYPPHMLTSAAVDQPRSVSFLSGSTGLGFYFSSQVAQLHQNRGVSGSLGIENGGRIGGGCLVVKLP